MQSLVTLGRQPALSLAELESLYGAAALTRAGGSAVIIDVEPEQLAFDRLGGAIKACKVLEILDTIQWRQIEKYLFTALPKQAAELGEGKLTLGVSVQGFDVNLKQLEATGLNLKKMLRKTGRSVRLVPNKELELNTAQVHHNKLTGPNGWELILIRDYDRTIIAQTVRVQDIESYTYRDRERPKRDARVGMLPPKLAQIIINLAVGPAQADNRKDQVILDPFCGTGVVLQEAALMGYTAYGTDLEPRMIDYTEKNLTWLDQHYGTIAAESLLQKGDATNHTWEMPVTFVAGETYLGKPFTSAPAPEPLAQTIADCNLIIKKFLKNLHSQIPAGTRLCLAVPAWSTGPQQNQFKNLPLIDQMDDLGYNRISFEHAGDAEMIYHRPDQYVARQLLVITKK